VSIPLPSQSATTGVSVAAPKKKPSDATPAGLLLVASAHRPVAATPRKTPGVSMPSRSSRR
jgi:hypothetical protein